MKKVFDNSMVAHVWAQGSQSEGRSNNGQFYFEGAAIYSYGSHFLAGFLLPNGKDAFVNGSGHSVTTSKHMNYVRRAVRGREITLQNLTSLHTVLNLLYSPDINPRRDIAKAEKGKGLLWARNTLESYAEKGLSPEGSKDLLKVFGYTDTEIARIIVRGEKKRDADMKAAKAARMKEGKRVAARLLKALPSLKAFQNARFVKPLNSYYHDQAPETALEWPSEFANDHALTGFDLGVFERVSWNQEPQGAKEFTAHINRQYTELKRYATKAQASRLWPYVKHARALAKALEARIEKDRELSLIKASFVTIRKLMGAEYDTPLDAFNAVSRADSALYWKGKISMARAKRFAPELAAFMRTVQQGAAEHKAKMEREAEERAAKEMEEKRESFAKWKAGESVSSWNLPVHPKGRSFAFLRIKGDMVTTSLGADVPLDHAVKLYRFMKAIKQPWEADANAPVRVGHFTLDSVIDGVASIGCHKLHFDDMNALWAEYAAREGVTA